MGQSKKLNKQPSSLSPLVQLAGIRKCFDGKEVIPQLDLTINNGEFLTLLGFPKLRTFPPHDRVRKCGLWVAHAKNPRC